MFASVSALANVCGVNENLLEHLDGILEVIKEIINNEQLLF